MKKEIFFTLTIAANSVIILDNALNGYCYCTFNGGQLEKVLSDLYMISYFPSENDAIECVKTLRELGVTEPVMLSKSVQEDCYCEDNDYMLFVSESNQEALHIHHDSLNGECYADFIHELDVRYI